jgi:uncharacterized protein DUF4304
MNKSIAQKTIWASLAPLLEEAGFLIVGDTGRRFSSPQIAVVGLQWFGAALAKRFGCTVNSFAVRLGCHFKCIPSSVPLQIVNGEPQPSEAHCHVRKTLFKAFKQPECASKEIWYVDTKGQCLDSVAAELRSAISREAFPWFQRFSDMREVLRTFREDGEDREKGFGFGRNPSPIRHLYRGFVALEVGDKEMAAKDLCKALGSSCFATLQTQIELAIGQTQ